MLSGGLMDWVGSFCAGSIADAAAQASHACCTAAPHMAPSPAPRRQLGEGRSRAACSSLSCRVAAPECGQPQVAPTFSWLSAISVSNWRLLMSAVVVAAAAVTTPTCICSQVDSWVDAPHGMLRPLGLLHERAGQWGQRGMVDHRAVHGWGLLLLLRLQRWNRSDQMV